MCITEYDEKTFVDGIRAEGRAEDRAEGRANERLEAIQNMLKYSVSREKILEDYSEEEIQAAENAVLAKA